MADQIVPWCYYGWHGEPRYAIGIARSIAEQVNPDGQPLVGGKPVEGEKIGPPPQGFRPLRVTVWNPQTQKKRQVTVFSMSAPLVRTLGKRVEIQLREKDGTTSIYQTNSSWSMSHEGPGRPATATNQRYPGWRYTTDEGYTYVLRVARALGELVDPEGKPLIGGQPMAGMVGMPVGLTPRSVTIYCPETVKTREVVVYSTEAPLWTGAATTIQVRDGAKGLLTYHVRSKSGEMWPRHTPRDQSSERVLPVETEEEFDSVIEAAFWRTWERTTNIRLVPQHPILGYRLDFAYLPTRTAIELDGYYYHADPERFRKDRQRDRALTEHGWRVVRFAGAEVLENVERCVEEALRLIRTRSVGSGDST